MGKNDYMLAIKADFDISDVIKGLNDIQKAAENGVKNITKTFMDDLSSMCIIAVKQISDVIKENLFVDLIGLNSTFEMTGAIIYEKFRDPLSETIQEVSNYITELNKNMISGELSESISEIAETIGELSSEIIRFTGDNVIPTLVTGIEKIAKHMDLLKGIIILTAAEFVTFKAAAVVTPVVKVIVDVNKAMYSLSEGINEELIQQIALITGMKHAEIEADIYMGKLNAAKIVTSALSSETFKLNAAIAGIGALVGVTAWLINYAATADTLHNRIRDINKAIEESKRIAEDSIAASEVEIAVLKNKAEQYEELREKENRTAGEEERLKNLAEDIQQYMPEGTQLINEQTGAYESLGDSIEEVIDSMRRRAKMSAYEELYTELIKQQLEAEKNIEEAEKNFELANTRGVKVGANAFQNVVKTEVDSDLREAQEALDNVNAEIANLEKKFDDLYADVNKSEEIDLGMMSKMGFADLNQIKQYAAEQINKWKEPVKEILRAAKLIPPQTWNELQTSLADLDDQLAIHNIDDTEYWDERLRLLQASQYRENKEWWKYYDETVEHFNKLSEAEKKAHENEIKAEVDALKEMKETDENGYYDRLEILISTLDKESDLYKQYNSEIVKGRKALDDKIAKETAESKKDQIAAAAKTVKEVQAEYSQMLSDVLTEQESYKNKLIGIAQLYTTETQTDDNGNTTQIFTLENIDKQIKAVEAYDNKLKNLKSGEWERVLQAILKGFHRRIQKILCTF